MKYLELYEECMRIGKLPINGVYSHIHHGGLCSLIGETNLWILSPTEEDLNEIRSKYLSVAYWGSELCSWHKNRLFNLTPLRQNIILFLAAINGELD